MTLLRKMESRIPKGYKAADLGYTTKDSETAKYALICDLCSPLSINPLFIKELSLEYSCFVKDDKPVLTNYTFMWTVEIKNTGGIIRRINSNYIKASGSIMRLAKADSQPTFFLNDDFALIVTVTILCSGVREDLVLTHEIVEESTTNEPYPITYALEQIPTISAAGTPEITSAFIYSYINYIMYSISYRHTPPIPTPPPIPIIFLSAILYPRALVTKKTKALPPEKRRCKLPKIATMIKSASACAEEYEFCADFMEYELGTFLITPDIASKYIGKFNDLQKGKFEGLPPSEKLNRLIDIYNVMRFPKSSIQIVADILKEINNEIKYMEWVVVGDINKDKCERVMEIFLCELKSSETELNDFTTYINKLYSPYIQILELSGLRALSITKDPYKKMEYTFRDGSKIVRNMAKLVPVGNETKKIGTISFIAKDNTNIFTLHDKCGDFYELLRISTNDWFNERTRGTTDPITFIRNAIVVSALDKFLNHAIEKYYSNYKQNIRILKPGFHFAGGTPKATNERGSGKFEFIIMDQALYKNSISGSLVYRYGLDCEACSAFMVYYSLGLIRPDLSRVEVQKRYSYLGNDKAKFERDSSLMPPMEVGILDEKNSKYARKAGLWRYVDRDAWTGVFLKKIKGTKAPKDPKDPKKSEGPKGTDWAKLTGMWNIAYEMKLIEDQNVATLKAYLNDGWVFRVLNYTIEPHWYVLVEHVSPKFHTNDSFIEAPLIHIPQGEIYSIDESLVQSNMLKKQYYKNKEIKGNFVLKVK